MTCESLYGKPCKCRRATGHCTRCGQEITVSVGERANPPIATDEKGRLLNHICARCRR